jgi:hypothetical protein
MTAISEYADFLVSKARKQNEFAKSKGCVKAYYVLSNNNARKDEPDLYLVTVSDRMATPAEQISRGKEMNAFTQSDDRKDIVASRQRATYRHITATCCCKSWSRRTKHNPGAPCRNCAAVRLSP